jgi:hypothetical protein
MPTLSQQAFMPIRFLDKQERQKLVARRDHLFSQCAADEQACLLKLAGWFALRRPGVFSPFSKSHMADFNYRYFPWRSPKPNVFARGLAKAHTKLYELGNWRGQRFQRRFVQRLQKLLDDGQGDVLLGVINFFRSLPLELDCDAQKSLEQSLDEMATKCVASTRSAARTRMETVVRSLEASPEGDHARNLREQIWPLLLELAQADIDEAVRVVDEHWKAEGSSMILFSLYLHEAPSLAYRLAVTFQPHRLAFAADMMCVSLQYASWELAKVDAAGFAALEKIMDASCQLLACWTFDPPMAPSPIALRAMSGLLQYGNSEDSYWRMVPVHALDMLRKLDHTTQRSQLPLIAQVAFYTESSSQFQADALAFFDGCVGRILGRTEELASFPERTVWDVCRSLSVLENKTLSFRNRRISADPAHPLQVIVERHFKIVLDGLLALEPNATLDHLVSFATSDSTESMVRKYHGILRAVFERQARQFPAEAGAAMKRLVQYCHYSHIEDEMYRSHLCKESFDMLLPILEQISPAHAAVARSGIGWNPRDAYM